MFNKLKKKAGSKKEESSPEAKDNKEIPSKEGITPNSSKNQNNIETNNKPAEKIKLKGKKAGQKLTVLLIDQIKKLMEINASNDDKIKQMQDTITNLTDELNKTKEVVGNFDNKVKTLEGSMDKIIGLYELVTNQYNPFLAGEKNIQNKNENQAPASGVVKEISLDNAAAADAGEQQFIKNTAAIKVMQETAELTEDNEDNKENIQPKKINGRKNCQKREKKGKNKQSKE